MGDSKELVERSNRLGSDPRYTNYAGGNTSAKVSVIDPATGEAAQVMFVKGSGGDLGTLTHAGLAGLYVEKLKALNASPAPQVLSRAVNTPCFLAFLTRFLRSGNSKVTEPAASNHNSLLLSVG